MRACSKPASVRSCEARTKMPGRPFTAEREGRKVSAGFRCQKKDGLLRFRGDGDLYPFFPGTLLPGLDAG